ncbi:MAG: PleD family two-component system response regulator [Alphaproteobacteria bacterium]|nr:MAG: PleD family two-component system response regulator [Alphaproteobacteria bacterium]
MSGRILVVDDTASNRVILKAKLSAAYFTVMMAESGAEALRMVAEEEPDLVLLDVMMPDLDGFEVCRRLKAAEASQHIPVIMVTAQNLEEERIKGLEVGADDFLTKNYNDVTLFARVRNLVRMKTMFDELRIRSATTEDLGLSSFLLDAEEFSEASSLVLFVAEPLELASQWMGEVGGQLAARAICCSDPAEALGLVERGIPDAVVVNHALPDGQDGRRLVSALRACPPARHAAIIFVAPESDNEMAAQALDLGANDYVLTPFPPVEMVTRLRSQLKRKLLSDRLRASVRDGLKLAVIDPLTGLFNRRYATRHLDTMLERARDQGGTIAALMLDIDRFKQINDRYGHEAGDDVLKEFSRRLKENVRGVDLVARLGGEEFLVVLPDVDAELAGGVAERIRGAVEMPGFTVRGGEVTLDVTVSIGASMARGGAIPAHELIRRADAALYHAKNSGRNRVFFSAAA